MEPLVAVCILQLTEHSLAHFAKSTQILPQLSAHCVLSEISLSSSPISFAYSLEKNMMRGDELRRPHPQPWAEKLRGFNRWHKSVH